MHTDPRRGFKLIELMVVIFVIAVAMGVLIPAVQSARNAGRRTECQNNMRQIGLALMGFSNARGTFPNAGTFLDDPAVHQGDPIRSIIYRSVHDPASIRERPRPWLRSWIVDVLPYFDIQCFYNLWNFHENYLSTVATSKPAANPQDPEGRPDSSGEMNCDDGSSPGNLLTARTAIGILRCPEDDSTVPNEGNLSYVVNGGFARWYAIPISWTGSKAERQSRNGDILRWVAPGEDWMDSLAIGKKLGVMFLGTHSGDQPWDIRTTPADISDGASNTILVGENTLAGYSKGTPHSGGQPTNWACPLPNFSMFLASDNICRSTRSDTDCLAGQLAPRSTMDDGPGWAMANRRGSSENINAGLSLSVEGSFPFLNSQHSGGSNLVFCDGAVRFVSQTIDGTVYAKLITPAGSGLPDNIKQSSLSHDAFAQ